MRDAMQIKFPSQAEAPLAPPFLSRTGCLSEASYPYISVWLPHLLSAHEGEPSRNSNPELEMEIMFCSLHLASSRLASIRHRVDCNKKMMTLSDLLHLDHGAMVILLFRFRASPFSFFLVYPL